MSGTWEQSFRPIEINLLKLHEERQSAAGTLAIAVLAAVVIGTGVVGFLWTDAHREAAKADKEIAAVSAQIEKAEAAAKQAPAASAGIADFIALPDLLASSKPQPTEVLNELNKLLPLEADIVTLHMQDNGSIQVTAIFSSLENVITFIQSVKASAHFALDGMSGLNKLKKPESQAALNAGAADLGGAEMTTLSPVNVTFELSYRKQSEQKEGGASNDAAKQ
ncbi:MAG TPA: hypothetical protein VF260_09770 [Bacilli bacterium]